MQQSQGLMLRHTLRLNEGVVNQVAWSPDGTMIAAGCQHAVGIWDSTTGELVARTPHRPMHFYCLDWMRDGNGNNQLITGSADKRVTVWQINNAGLQPVDNLSGPTDTINCVAVSENGGIAVCGNDHSVIVVLPDGRMTTLDNHTDEVNIVAWSPDGTSLVSCGNDSRVVLWRTVWGDGIYQHAEHAGVVNCVACHPDNSLVASAADDGTVRLFRVEDHVQTKTIHVDQNPIHWVGFDTTGKILGTRSASGLIRFWRTDTWESVATITGTVSHIVIPTLEFHPSRAMIAMPANRDHVVQIWEYDLDTLLDLRLHGTQVNMEPVSFQPVNPLHLETLLKLWPIGADMNNNN